MSKPTDVPESTKPERMIRDEDCLPQYFKRTPAASPVAPPESTRSLAELLTDFVIAHGNKYSPLRDTPEIQAALTVSKEAYETHRVHDFTTAHRESIIAGLANLLASPVAGGSADEVLYYDDFGGRLYLGSTPFAQMLGACNENTHEDARRVVQLWNTSVPEGWVKVTPETMPRTGAACLIVWSGQVQNALYRRAGIGFACAGGYEWRRADDDEADAIPDAEVEFWKPKPCPPAAEEERSL